MVKTYKKKNKPHKTFANKLNREFEAFDGKNRHPRVVCDITEWKLHNWKKVYLCAAIDLATRAVIGYKVALNCTSSLVTDVLNQIRKKLPTEVILFHSDQGSQFTSQEVVNKIKAFDWVQSMSRKGNCWDNAVIESFFSSIKREELKWHVFHSFIQAERVVREYIEEYYMVVRPHTALGGISPIQYILAMNLSTKTQK